MPVAVSTRHLALSGSFHMRFILGLTLLTGLAFGCGDDDGPVGPGTDAGTRDSGTRDSGGGGTDSGPDEDGGPDEDSGTPEDGGGVDSGGGGSCPDLMPTGDETLIISQIDIATRRVELFNPGAADVVIGEEQWCDQPRYNDVAGTGPTVIPAGGYAVHTLPSGYLTNASGELAIYESDEGRFSNGALIIDFVCWGTGRADGSGRRDEATGAAKWAGDCLPMPTMGAIIRRAGTSGTGASSYDTTSAFEPTTCD